jgi:hypothetical protein
MTEAREFQQLLLTIVDYNPETGLFIWRKKPRHLYPSDARYKAANTQCCGKPAFITPQSTGYLAGSVLGNMYLAHRVAWLISHGEWPDQIDHVNGQRTDNRLANLRNVSAAENNKNIACRPNSQSGVTGVRWHKAAGKWVARIHVDGKEEHLGLFVDFSAAVKARFDAQRRHNFHPNHGRKSNE